MKMLELIALSAVVIYHRSTALNRMILSELNSKIDTGLGLTT